MAWSVAPSVKAALEEATRRWPARSKLSDGTIGDPAHSSRVSDHNPGARNLVHAFDLTHDAMHGVDCFQLSNLLYKRVLSGEEKRVKYVIFNKRIFTPSVSKAWRPYTGSNPHTKHMHVSIRSTVAAENDLSPWWSEAITVPSNETTVLARYLLEGTPVILKLIHITTDANGDGSYPVSRYVVHAPAYADRDKYAPPAPGHQPDGETRLGPLIGARLAENGTVRLVVAGGPPNGQVPCLVTVAD